MWKVVGVGDFNCDGTSDVLWQNQSDGTVGAWIIKNSAYIITGHIWAGPIPRCGRWSASVTSTATAPRMSLWQNQSTGLVGAWLVKNGVYTNWASVGGADPKVWNVVGVGDFNFNGTAGVHISQSGVSTNVTEGGATDSYTVVLSSQPTANVTVNISPDSQVSVDKTSLIFTSANWNTAQTVTVTAVDDSVAEGNRTVTITHSVSSTDAIYNGISVDNVIAQITDNDTAGVHISRSTTNVTEGGATDSYTVVLSSQPTANVTVNISPNSQVLVNKTSLTFTSANWNTAQTVTVTAVDDSAEEGSRTVTITHSASSADTNYNGISVVDVTVQITDNDGVQSFTLTGPTATTMSTSVGMYTTGQTVQINWTAANVVSGSVVHLFYDEDTTPGNGNEHLIANNVSAASGNGSYTWNTTGLHGGIYNIGGYMYDNAGHYTYSYLQLPITILETFDVTYSLPTTGTTYYVHQGNNLQTVIDSANLGDVIVLDAGATFTGNFKLPNKTTGSGWIYIISSDMASLPAEGTRVGPADAAHMPKITTTGDPALFTVFAAHNYRFAGIEFSTSAAITNLILMGYGLTNYSDPIWQKVAADSLGELPHNITFDRCYIHSTSDSNYARAGICANGRYIAVVDSYLSNFKDTADAQAILVYNGSGPIKIVNNYLEATGENVMFGGSDPTINHTNDPADFPDVDTGLVPADIEIRGNYFYKRNDWNQFSSSYNNVNWAIKNSFEIKNAQRVLIDGNIFDNCWADAQTGRSVVLKAANQDGAADWSKCWDVTFQNNIIRNAAGGIDLSASETYNGGTTAGIKRVLIRNNLVDLTSADSWVGTLFLIGLHSPSSGTVVAEDITIDHNTIIGKLDTNTMASVGDGTEMFDNVAVTNNILRHGQYGFKGTGHAEGSDTMNYYLGDYSYRRNLMVDMNSTPVYPADNYRSNNIDSAGFVDYAHANYRLDSVSPYKNAGTDGKDLGVGDYNALDDATLNAISGGR